MSEHVMEAFLLSVGTNIEADMIESLLRANDIPVLRKYREAGGYLMVMMGGTVYGVDIYVPEDLLDKAREAVENSREASEDASFPDNVKPAETTEDGAADEGVTDEGAAGEGAAGEGAAGEGVTDESCAGAAGQIEEEPASKVEETGSDSKAQEEAIPYEREMSAEEQKIGTRRRKISRLMLFFASGLILLLIALIKYLFDLFSGK